MVSYQSLNYTLGSGQNRRKPSVRRVWSRDVDAVGEPVTECAITGEDFGDKEGK